MWLIFLRSEYFIGSFVLAILSFSLSGYRILVGQNLHLLLILSYE